MRINKIDKIDNLLILLAILIMTLLLHASVYAAGNTVRPWTYGQLEKIEKKIKSKAYDQALAILGRTLPKAKDVAYEKAVLLRTYAQIFALKNDYPRATRYLKQCVDLNALPKNQQAEAKRNLLQLQMAVAGKKATRGNGKMANGKMANINAGQLEAMVKRNRAATANDWMRVANAYTQNKLYGRAVAPLQRAIKLSRGKVPHSWHQMLLGLYQHQKNYKASIKVLKKLLVWYPRKKDYWEQLAITYQHVKDYKSAIAVNEMRLKKGYLVKPSQLVTMASLYLHQGLPYRAAELLEKNMQSGKIKKSTKHLKLLGNAWAQAREFEKSVDVLQQVAVNSTDGQSYLRIGKMLMEIKHWNKAKTALQTALKKGGVDKGNVWLLVGMCYREAPDMVKAREAFVKASKYSNSQKAARQWLDYLDSKKKERDERTAKL